MPKPVFQLLVVIFLSFFTIDFAISDDVDDMFVNRLKGWEGLAFYCSEAKNNKNSICAAIKTDAEFLATASGINFYIAKDFTEALNFQYSHNYLMLKASVDLVASSSTNNRCSTCAFLVGLRAFAYYVFGNDKDIHLSPDSPMAIPRSGIFVLWRRDTRMVFTGPWEYGRDPTIKDVENKLKQFFTLFMKANPK